MKLYENSLKSDYVGIVPTTDEAYGKIMEMETEDGEIIEGGHLINNGKFPYLYMKTGDAVDYLDNLNIDLDDVDMYELDNELNLGDEIYDKLAWLYDADDDEASDFGEHF